MSEPVCLQAEAPSPRKRGHDVPKSKKPMILQASIGLVKSKKNTQKVRILEPSKIGIWREPQNEPQDNLRVQKSLGKVRKTPDFL